MRPSFIKLLNAEMLPESRFFLVKEPILMSWIMQVGGQFSSYVNDNEDRMSIREGKGT